jgi:hypothetical protein
MKFHSPNNSQTEERQYLSFVFISSILLIGRFLHATKVDYLFIRVKKSTFSIFLFLKIKNHHHSWSYCHWKNASNSGTFALASSYDIVFLSTAIFIALYLRQIMKVWKPLTCDCQDHLKISSYLAILLKILIKSTDCYDLAIIVATAKTYIWFYGKFKSLT